MSTAFRPQTDGQTERVNLVLQEYLRNYVNADQTDWADHISMAEFSYNNTKHSGTGFSPFMVVSGTEPLSPIDLAFQKTLVKNGDEGEVVETKIFPRGARANLGVSEGDLSKGSKALQTAGEQEPEAGEFQGRAEGVVECEEFHTSVGPNAQVHG